MPESLAMPQIPTCEVKFHPHSFADHGIRLFRWNGQIYRGVDFKKTPYFTQLFHKGVIQNLFEKGLLIESELTNLSINGYETVIQHRSIPFLSYPNEWCAAMLKQSALTLIELAIELAHYDLTLGDGHPWNLLIDPSDCKPIFVDLGSITPIRNSGWSAYDEFCRFCLYPLMLMADGQELIARLLMCEDQGVLKSDLARSRQGKAFLASGSKRSIFSFLQLGLWKWLPESSRQGIKKALKLVESSRSKPFSESESDVLFLKEIKRKAHLKFLESVKQEIQSITLPMLQDNSNRTETNSPQVTPQENWTLKQQNLHKILTELQPVSVLDISCQRGWYSRLAALLGSQVIAFDTDEACVTQLYYDAQAQKLPILPLIMDFTKSTPARGLSNHWAIAATDRFQCDLVLALGVLHQIVAERRLNFDQIVEGLALFSQRWVVVEFIPPEDLEVSQSRLSQLSWYTIDQFIHALKKHFRIISTMPSSSESRILIICEKQNLLL